MVEIENKVIEKLDALATKEINSAILFRFAFKSLNVRCIYFSSTKTIIVAIAGRNSAWSIDLSSGKMTESVPNEAYTLIKDVLKRENVYVNKDFFVELKRVLENINSTNVETVTKNQILESLRDTKTRDKNYDKEGEKPYFDHWRRVKPSKDSLNKIQRTFGQKVREECFSNKVTGVWHEIPSPNSLNFLDPDSVILEIKGR